MNNFENTFKIKKTVIGMIHVEALPGTPKFKGDFKKILDKAIKEALIYKDTGIDAIGIENMHDVPYLKRSIGPEITSAMSIIGYEVKNQSELPCGIQILAGANKEALATANAAGLDFIRAEGFVFSHVADEGIIESDAGELLRYRKSIDAENILILTDIKKKHSSHSITSDVSIVETAKAAEFFLSDGVIISGNSTGKQADECEIKATKENVNLPVLVGSGITEKNVEKYLPIADGFIVGSYFKKDGYWENDIDKNKVANFMKRVNQSR